MSDASGRYSSGNSGRRSGSRPQRGSRPSYGGGRGGGGRGGGGGRKPDLPMLLGEPSPSLAKINEMNMVKLQAKIDSLVADRVHLVAKAEKLKAADPPQPEKAEETEKLIARLDALKAAAQERLDGKAERKALREAGKL